MSLSIVYLENIHTAWSLINHALFWIGLYALAFLWYYCACLRKKNTTNLSPSTGFPNTILNYFVSTMAFILPGLIALSTQPRLAIPHLISVPIGGACLLLAAYIELAARRRLGFFPGGAFPGLQKHNTLVTSGIYSTIRHPIYVGIILWQIGLALLLQATYALVFSIVFIFALMSIIILEERELREKYGSSHIAYRRRTPWMLIPHIFQYF